MLILCRKPNFGSLGTASPITPTMDEGEEPEILEFEDEDGREQALIDYNIQPGDHLHLISVPIAG